MPNHQQDVNVKLPEGNQFWLKKLGQKVLSKIYEEGATPGNANEPGSIAQTFQGVYQESGLHDGALAISLHHQKDRISLGKLLKGINRYFTSDQDLVNARQDYLTQVASVVWAVKDLADKQGDHFARGSIKIKDPSSKLFGFLKGYVQFSTKAENPGFLLGANDFAYNRDKLSSHYTTFETEQYGIDMRFTGGQPALEILPCSGDSHLLFGRVKIKDEWYTFIKAEPVGLAYPLESLEHAGHLLLPKKQHIHVTRKEKEIPKPLKDAYEEYYVNERFYIEPNPDVAGMSRRQWHDAQASGIPLDIVKWYPKATTVAGMYEEMNTFELKSNKGLKAVRKFNKAVKNLHFKKDIEIRTGNEVILDLRKLPDFEELNDPPKPYLVKREARIENNPERQMLNNVIDLTADNQDGEIDHKRKSQAQGSSSKRLRK